MCSYVKNAIQTGSNNDDRVEVETQKLLKTLGLGVVAEITEDVFVQHLQKAYEKDRETASLAVKQALDIMSSQPQQVRDHCKPCMSGSGTIKIPSLTIEYIMRIDHDGGVSIAWASM